MDKNIIDIKNLNFSYKKTHKEIEDMVLHVPKGSIYGFLGPNGAGKSTTIRLILGLLKKHSGTVALFREKFNAKTRIEILNKVGALIENPSLYDHLNAVDNLRIAASYRQHIGHDRINEVLEIVNLVNAKKKNVKEFSLGMKQRLGIAISLLSNPELIILDEPTNGLDPKGIIEMRMLITDLNKKYGTTIFISSHLLSEIEKTCTHVGIIRNGKMVYEDTVKALKESKGKNITIEIDTDKHVDTMKVLEQHNKKDSAMLNGLVQIDVEDKEEIIEVIDILRSCNINIYQVSIKNNLEDLFLELTEN
ncbi:ATP-binding cassette domain-containing protein [Labilibaculum manganireducens]|uniref:ABC transporter ATP-binding protein n=1 Tax=Labilibaculum manganireducens TaxID=1940525 RepID=UPI0029F48ACF|nr:ATP-binding cassette domain-containing protein [Labilibaculum manganireducens]